MFALFCALVFARILYMFLAAETIMSKSVMVGIFETIKLSIHRLRERKECNKESSSSFNSDLSTEHTMPSASEKKKRR